MSGGSTRRSRSKGKGAAAYLDIAGVIAAARKAGCDSVHPGYGFLSENADFAEACAEARITFVGPTPEQLKLFGDKARARAHAAEMQGAGAAGHRCDRPRGRRGVLQEAREVGHRAESHRRRRRARHAADQVRGRDRRRLCARLGRSQVGVRQRRSLCRAAGRPRAPHRGADRGRRQGRHRGPGRARMHPAAAQPEDRRAGAQPQPQAGAAQEDRRCRRRHGQGREVPQPRHLRVPGRRGGRSSSSRPIRACRSSTPSPRRCGASIW